MMSMRRREFITLVGGAAAAWRWRRGRSRTDAQGGSAFWPVQLRTIQQHGPTLLHCERILRNSAGLKAATSGSIDPDRIRTYAVELVTLAPDVIVTMSSPATTAVQDQTKTIPIIFTSGIDPATQGVLQNIARPEGNMTGFSSTVDSIGGKWLELLKEAAPHVTRVTLVFNPRTVNVGFFRSMEAAAPLLHVEAIKTPVLDPLETVRAIDAFAIEPGGGLLVVPVLPPDSYQMLHRVVAQHPLPAIHFNRGRVSEGGLMSYATDFPDLYRRAAAYVNRLLRGAKVSELPVQFPTKFELLVNLKTAKAIGLTIPETFLVRADEVIE
jgi:putative ABC transport system substrate-binding protein